MWCKIKGWVWYNCWVWERLWNRESFYLRKFCLVLDMKKDDKVIVKFGKFFVILCVFVIIGSFFYRDIMINSEFFLCVNDMEINMCDEL